MVIVMLVNLNKVNSMVKEFINGAMVVNTLASFIKEKDKEKENGKVLQEINFKVSTSMT